MLGKTNSLLNVKCAVPVTFSSIFLSSESGTYVEHWTCYAANVTERVIERRRNLEHEDAMDRMDKKAPKRRHDRIIIHFVSGPIRTS